MNYKTVPISYIHVLKCKEKENQPCQVLGDIKNNTKTSSSVIVQV